MLIRGCRSGLGGYGIANVGVGDELYNYLIKNGRLTVDRTKRIFAQLVGAVSYVHMNNCVHRDLKLENILLDKHENVRKPTTATGIDDGGDNGGDVGIVGLCAGDSVADTLLWIGQTVRFWFYKRVRTSEIASNLLWNSLLLGPGDGQGREIHGAWYEIDLLFFPYT